MEHSFDLTAYPIGHYPVPEGSYVNVTAGIRYLVKEKNSSCFIASIDVRTRLMAEQDLGMKSGINPFPDRVELFNSLTSHYNELFGENNWVIKITQYSPDVQNYLELLDENFMHFRCLGAPNYDVIKSKGTFSNYRTVKYLGQNEELKTEDDREWYNNESV